MMAPVGAVHKIWEKTGWKKDDVDLYELNEAFSVQALGVIRELGLDMNRVNVNGGAVALGHPIGASGARVLVTLIYEMIGGMCTGDRGAVPGRGECGGYGGGAVGSVVDDRRQLRASLGLDGRGRPSPHELDYSITNLALGLIRPVLLSAT